MLVANKHYLIWHHGICGLVVKLLNLSTVADPVDLKRKDGRMNEKDKKNRAQSSLTHPDIMRL
jgi:hypothetical protein